MDESNNSGPTTPKKNNKDKTQYNDPNNKFSILNSNKDSKKVKTNLFRTQDTIHGTNKLYDLVTLHVGDHANALKCMQEDL